MLEKYTPLYLKYRPQSLAELVGQHSVAQTLVNAIEHDRISHAYLFTGPRGTGKTSSARILAKSLNCEQGPTVTPCQICSHCLEIKEGNSPAVFELDAASNNSVDDARALIERAPLVAQGGRFKLYIIDECHMLTKEAFNALLKTIEEPPPGVIFVLATTEEHKVPPTIVSRCQRLMFKLVNQDELKVHLRSVGEKESINIDEDALELIARRSGGGLRDALGLLDQAGLLSTSEKAVGVSDLLSLLGAVQEDVLLQISAGIRDKDGSAILASIHSLLIDGREPAVLIQEMAKHFLNLARSCYNLAAKKGQGTHSTHPILGSPSYISGLALQAESYDPAEIAQIVELLDKLEQIVRRSSQPAMNLEMGLLSICHRHEIRLLKELEDRIAKLEGALTENGIDMPHAARSGAHAAPRPQGSTAAAPVQPPAPARPAPPYSPPANNNNNNTNSYSSPPRITPAPAPAQATTAPVPTNGDARPHAPSMVHVPSPSISQSPPSISMGDDEDEYVPDNSDADDVESSPPPFASGASAPPAMIDNAAMSPGAVRAQELSRGSEAARAPEQARTQVSGPPPAPAQKPAVSTPSSRAAAAADPGHSADSHLSSNNASGTELDEMWSDITEALQGRHLPTFSILTTCAFPIAFEKDKNDLVIGVRKDHFLKMIESKAEHIKGAYASVSGKTISVRVKVVADDAFSSPPKQPTSASAGRESRPKPTQPTGPDESGESDRGNSQRPAPSPQNRDNSQANAPHNGNSHESRRDYSAPKPAMFANMDHAEPAVDRRPDPAAARRAPNAAANASGSGLVSDAYKIFEGPGSRLLN